jgi:hypothetical protein
MIVCLCVCVCVCVCIHTGMQPWRLGEDPDALTQSMKELGLIEVKASSCEVALATGMCSPYMYALYVYIHTCVYVPKACFAMYVICM